MSCDKRITRAKARKFIVKTLVLITVFMFFCFVLYLSTVISNNTSDLKDKYNLFIQIVGNILTFSAILITLRALRISQLQKNYSVRPYLVVSSIDIYKVTENRSSLDFYVINEGLGLALDINVSVIRKVDKTEIYKKNFTRLNTIENPSIEILNDMRNQLVEMNNKEKGSKSTSINGSSSLEIEIEFNVEEKDKYRNVDIYLTFNDIYGKVYQNTFFYKYDVEEMEFNDCVEKHFEI